MIQKQYFGGATQLVSGATMLDVKPMLKVEEGYQVGSSTHYVHMGDFEVENMSYSGAQRESISLSAKHPEGRLSNQQMIYPVTMKNGLRFYTDFSREGDFFNNFSTSASGVTERPDQGYVRFVSPTSGTIFDFQSKSDLPFVRAMMRFRFSNISGNAQIRFKHPYYVEQDLTTDVETVASLNSNTLQDKHLYAGSLSGTSSYANTFNANTWYWLRITSMGAKKRASAGDDIDNFSTKIDYFMDDSKHMSPSNQGSLQMLMLATGGGNVDISAFEVIEYADAITKEDALRKVYTLGNVHDLDFQDKISGTAGLSTFASAGATWEIVDDSTITFSDVAATGDSINWAMYMGVTLEDFTAEFEMKGSSQINIGAICGRPDTGDSWVGIFARASRNDYNTQFYQNYPGQYGLVNISGHGGHIGAVAEEKWHKVKFVKSGLFYGLYIDGKFMNGGHGTSLSDTNVQNTFFGVAVNAASQANTSAGASAAFRNIRISEYGDLLDGDLVIDPVSTLDNIASRVMDPGDAVINHGVTLEFIRKGSSRGAHEVGATALQDSIESVSYNVAAKEAWTFGKYNAIGLIDNTLDRIKEDGGDVRATYRDELSITDTSVLKKLSTDILKDDNEDVDTFAISINNRPTMEVYDEVNFVDERSTGVSEKLYIQGYQKNFTPGTGEFKMSIDLGRYE